jgi:hypothetical protein
VKTKRFTLAIPVAAIAVYPHDSKAVLLLTNRAIDIEWYVGQPVPGIDLAPGQFTGAASGPELTWVYEDFPAIPTCTIGGSRLRARSAIATPPAENECVIWRGDNARFIADNLTVGGR